MFKIGVFLTILAIASAGFYAYGHPETCSGASFGTYVSGIASAIGFLWLIPGYYSQQQELIAQRKTLDLQKEEMGKIAQSNTINIIAKMFNDHNTILLSKPVDLGQNSIKKTGASPVGLPRLFSRHFSRYCYQVVISEMKGNGAVNFGSWLILEKACITFVETFMTALNLYLKEVGDGRIVEQADLCFSPDDFMKIETYPFIQLYYPAAKRLIEDLQATKKNRNKARYLTLLRISENIKGTPAENQLNDLQERYGDIQNEELTEEFDKYNKLNNSRAL